MTREHDETAQQLRQALQREANRITPTDRQESIHAMTLHHDRTPQRRRPRWLAPVAAAAAVAVIAGGVWAVAGRTGGGSGPAATTEAASTAASNHTPTGVGTGTKVALPAYFVGPNGGSGDRWGLYREFLPGTLPAGATVEDRVKAALTAAMTPQPDTSDAHYLQPWAGTSVSAVTVDQSGIGITLDNQGPSGFSAEQTRLAVQELVWTAQAALGRGDVPVRFRVADGSTSLFGTYPTSEAYHRPPAGQSFRDLASIWITSPTRGQHPAGQRLVATGESCTFEGAALWQLSSGATLVRSGHLQATSGCPTRGTWQVSLGTLPAGSYTLRVYEPNQGDGTGTVADTTRAFTVR